MQNDHVKQIMVLPGIASWNNFQKVKFLSGLFTLQMKLFNIISLVMALGIWMWDTSLLCCGKIVKKLGLQLHLSWEFRTEAGIYWFLKYFLLGTQRGPFTFGTVFASLCFGSFQGSVKIITYICSHQSSNDDYFSLFSISCFRLLVFWIAAKQLHFFKNCSAKSSKQDVFPGVIRALSVLCYFNFPVTLFLILSCYWSTNTLSFQRSNKTMSRLLGRMKEKLNNEKI